MSFILLALMGCEPEPSAGVHQLRVRAHVDGALAVDGRSVPVIGERWQSVGGLGPPPRTVTLRHANGRLTVVDVPGNTLDLVRLQDAPVGRPGNLITLPVLPEREGEVQLIGIAREQVYRAVDGFIALPDAQPIDLWATWRRDGRLVGMTYRRILNASNWEGLGLALVPDIPVDATIDVQVTATPTGWAAVELTIDGVRTGLLLGEGLVSTRDAIRVPRPTLETIPGGGLWISARAPDAAVDVHLPLDTPSAAVDWPATIEPSPRPGPVDAGSLLTRDQPLRWPAQPGLMRLHLDTSDGCRAETWEIVAPAEPGLLEWPVVPGDDPLIRPSLRGAWQIEAADGLDYADRLSGADGPERLLPQRIRRRTRRRVEGTWRGASERCDPHPAQGRYFVLPQSAGACTPGDTAPSLVVDRCGHLIPTPADPQLCGQILSEAVTLAGRRQPIEAVEDGWLLGDRWRLLAPTAAGTAPPPEMIGEWYRAQVSEQPRATASDGGPGIAEAPAVRLAVGNPAAGPWARLDGAGRLTITLARGGIEARLTDYDGAVARFTILGGTCDEARSATGRVADGQLIIEEWLPASGVLRQWILTRQ